MIIHYFRTVKDTELKIIPAQRNGVWVHAESPTEKEVRELVENLGLDENILEDAKDFFEVPRLEKAEGKTYFYTLPVQRADRGY